MLAIAVTDAKNGLIPTARYITGNYVHKLTGIMGWLAKHCHTHSTHFLCRWNTTLKRAKDGELVVLHLSKTRIKRSHLVIIQSELKGLYPSPIIMQYCMRFLVDANWKPRLDVVGVMTFVLKKMGKKAKIHIWRGIHQRCFFFSLSWTKAIPL